MYSSRYGALSGNGWKTIGFSWSIVLRKIMLYAEYDFTQVTQYKKSAESKQAQGRRRWVEKL